MPIWSDMDTEPSTFESGGSNEISRDLKPDSSTILGTSEVVPEQRESIKHSTGLAEVDLGNGNDKEEEKEIYTMESLMENQNDFGPEERWRIMKNVIVLSLGFMVHFTAFQVNYYFILITMYFLFILLLKSNSKKICVRTLSILLIMKVSYLFIIHY